MRANVGAAIVVVVGLVVGCQNGDLSTMSRQDLGTALGGGIGAAVGATFGRGERRVLTAAAGGAIGAIVGNQIGRALDEREQAELEQQMGQALENAPDGQPVVWRSEAGDAEAVMTPRATRAVRKEVEVARDVRVAPPPMLELVGETYRARRDANVRAAPTTAADIVTTVREGDRTHVVGRVEGANWYLIARDRRSIGYVHGDLIEPAPAIADASSREPVDLDGLGADVVVERVAVRTECRTLEYEVTAGSGASERNSFEACKAADGAWELG